MSDELNPVIRALEARIAELEADRRRRRYGVRRLPRRLAIGLLGLALLIPGVALASHQFSDVPNSYLFHNSVDWAADYGIATGYSDGTYRPNDPVTRGQMTAFLKRLSGELEVVHTSVDPGSSSTFNASATCPGDKRPIAGGGHTSSVNLFMTDSSPFGSGWDVRWESDDNATLDPTAVEVWVLCAPRL
jgi:hypothetical protein